MSDCFDHQLDAFDSFQEYDCGASGIGPPIKLGPRTFKVLANEGFKETCKAILIEIEGESQWVPKSQIHMDPDRKLVVFKEDSSWFKLKRGISLKCKDLTRVQIIKLKSKLN